MANDRMPLFSGYDSPNMTPIMKLHRGHDGWIALCRRVNPISDDDDGWREMGSVRADEFGGIFDQLAPEVETDGYYSVNGFYRPGYGNLKDYGDLKLSPPNRKVTELRYLNACYADLDVGRPHDTSAAKRTSVADAVAAIIQLEEDGVIPPASMIARSGQGVWVFWILRDSKREHEPVRAFDEKIRLWVNVQAKITGLLAVLAADANARDAVRVTRVPGSINTRVNRRSDYWIPLGSDGRVHSYTLEELADLLDVRLPQSHPAVDAKKKELSARGQKGQRGRWLKARKNFEILWEKRSGFGKGVRNNAVFIYASILRSQCLEEEVVWAECHRLYLSLERGSGSDAYTVKEFNAAMTSAKGFSFRGRGATQYTVRGSGFGGIKNQTIADMLEVTPEESSMLDNWPPASRYQQPVTTTELAELGRREAQNRRQGLLKSKLAELSTVPSIRDLATWLAGQGLPCAPQTVMTDLKILGIANPRSEAVKRKKRAASRQRKFIE